MDMYPQLGVQSYGLMGASAHRPFLGQGRPADVALRFAGRDGDGGDTLELSSAATHTDDEDGDGADNTIPEAMKLPLGILAADFDTPIERLEQDFLQIRARKKAELLQQLADLDSAVVRQIRQSLSERQHNPPTLSTAPRPATLWA